MIVSLDGGRRRLPGLKGLAPSLLTTVGLLAVLELVCTVGVVSPKTFPAPTAIIADLWSELHQAGLWTALEGTLTGWLAGFGLAAAVGVPFGLLIGGFSTLYRSVRLVIEFLRPIPTVAVLPVVVLVLGTGPTMKILLVAFAALWPILFQAMYGIIDVDPLAIDAARAYGLTGTQRFKQIVLPSTLAYLATGFRLSIAVALSVDVAVEMILGTNGLGYLINNEQYAGRLGVMYGIVAVAGIIGFIANRLFRSLEARALHWHAGYRKSQFA